MRISAREVLELGLIDEVLPEPVGGAHRNYHEMVTTLKVGIFRHLAELKQMPLDELLEKRYQKFRSVGAFDRI
jgi:acetyl-CoA carboxylase carboxyl transferase subunit alpha